MRDAIVPVYKPVGATSHRIAREAAAALGASVTHTGTLDPMADGVLVLLIGPEAKRQQRALQAAAKEYRIEMVFGLATDTYDALGLVTGSAVYASEAFPEAALQQRLEALHGRQQQPVPAYCAKVVRGRPLFWWARHGRIDEVGLPIQEIELFAEKLLSLEPISKHALARRIETGIAAVAGDFRQEKIRTGWRTALAQHPNERFTVATLEFSVSGGTYVRSLVHRLDAALGLPAFALGITRTRCGGFGLGDCRPLAPG